MLLTHWIAAVSLLVSAAAGLQVTCMSTVKLQHQQHAAYLHSHEVTYGSGSGQQSVTGYRDADDSGGYWTISGLTSDPCAQGTPIKKGQAVRLFHTATNKWLHSHLVPSPITQQQEVSAYGSPSRSDTGDAWTVTWDGSAKTWESTDKVYLKHKDTAKWLAMSKKTYPRPIAGQHEVAAAARKDASGAWKAAEGVFFPSEGTAKGVTDEL